MKSKSEKRKTSKSSAAELSPQEKKEVKAKLRKIDHKHNSIDTAQKTIPYIEMYKDGVCHVESDYYTKTIQFFDINYQLARDEDKNLIFQKYCGIHNYFDETVTVQFSFMNIAEDLGTRTVSLPQQDDDFNDLRREFAEMLQNQLEKGNNGLLRLKYLTFGIHEKDRKTAKSRLEQLETEIINNFRSMGVPAYGLDGTERLHILHRSFNPNPEDAFVWDWKARVETGISTKDAIAPSSFNFGKKNIFQMGNVFGSTLYVDIISTEVSDRMLTQYLKLENNLFFNLHLRALDQTEAIKYVKRKMTAVDAMKVDEQKKAARAGYDIDILPPDLVTYSEELKLLLSDLQSRNERFFVTTISITCFAETQKKLDLLIRQIKSITQQNNCKLAQLDWQQEDALMSSVPLGINKIDRSRNFTTSAVSVFIPFTTTELFQRGDALYYGLNALSHNIIMADRKQLKNPNGLVLGTPGSGKSFSSKREWSNAFLSTTDDIIICDPEGEYYPLVNAFHGQVIKVSPTSPHHINPMDITDDYSDGDDPVTLKSDFILSLCELVVGGKYGLSPEERSIIDRCTRKVYQKYFDNPVPENMPILEDLYNLLRDYSDDVNAHHIASALELYVTGSLNLFNHRTNVDISNRLVCFDIKEVGKNLRKLAMLIVQDQVWNRVSANRGQKSTRYYIDEFHLLLKEEQTAAYSVEIWKRFRKWGGIPTGMTQNVKDLLTSKEIENILDNSDFICMLNQAPGDREILAQKLGISEYQLSHVTNSAQGEGLIFFGDVILPFVDRFPKDTKLYRLMTTKPEEQN
ncbi:MAG: VirB4-like conjugal transfer ATPase, CD1110 family [Oscillospiraceae bacterium]